VPRALAVAAVVFLLGLPHGAMVGAARQAEPGSPDDGAGTGRPAVCTVPDPAKRPPLTDGTDGDRGAAAEAGVLPDPSTFVLQGDLDRVARALAACLSSGAHRTVAELATGRYLGLLAGTGGVLTPATYVALAQDLPLLPVGIRAIDAVRREEPDAASAEVVYVVANQLVHGRWAFVAAPADPDAAGEPSAPATDATDPDEAERGTAEAAAERVRWQVDDETPLPVAAPPNATRVEVELDEYEIELGRQRVEASEGGLVLAAGNNGEREHEVLVLRLEDGADTEALLRQAGPRLPDGFVFAGQVTIPAGGQADLILVDLQPGRYALVSLLPDEDGVPDLARGMQAELRVD
jgi:hypothetical protein